MKKDPRPALEIRMTAALKQRGLSMDEARAIAKGTTALVRVLKRGYVNGRRGGAALLERLLRPLDPDADNEGKGPSE